MSAIVTHARVRSALAATRSLGKHGINVFTADSVYPSTSFFSKYSESYFLYPSAKSEPKLFIQRIRDFVNENDVDVLIPIYEETFVISKYRDSFSNVIVPLGGYKTLMKANNKQYLMNFASELGVKTPKTWTIKHIDEIEEIAKEINFPAVIKLVEGVGSKGIEYVHSEDELITRYKAVTQKFNLKSSYPLVQEYIPGEGYGVEMLFNQGELRAIFTHKRIREYPITGGPSTARISVKHPEMEKNAIRLLEELKWHGVAMVEFKLDERNNEPVLMEVNPRFWGSLNQAISAGVDFPYLLYKMATEGDVKPVFEYRTGVKSRWMLGDCRALIGYLRTEKRLKVLKEFFKFNGQSYDDLSMEDPLPAFVEFFIPLINLIKTGKPKFSPEEAS